MFKTCLILGARNFKRNLTRTFIVGETLEDILGETLDESLRKFMVKIQKEVREKSREGLSEQ